MITGDVMLRLCARLDRTHAEAWGDPLQAAAEEFGIDSDNAQSMWLAQLCHESAGFTVLVENLNYSAKRLAQVWPYRYAVDPKAIDLQPNALAMAIGGKPDCVANDVYARRNGNGEPSTGDGWRYRGRYPAQLTGRANYQAAQDGTGVPCLDDPDAVLRDLAGMARICGWFWQSHNLSRFADEGDFGAIVRVWNGGNNGMADRIAWHKRALDALGVA